MKKKKKKKDFSAILLVLIFFVGLSVLLYPTISDYVNSRTQSRAISSYNSVVEQMDETDYETELEHAFEVSRMTDETIGSMVQDVTHHRETEIRIINGAVSRLGKEHGIPTPCNDLILNLVLAKQSLYLGR